MSMEESHPAQVGYPDPMQCYIQHLKAQYLCAPDPGVCTLQDRVDRWLQRPARPQIGKDENVSYAYIENQNNYNIWYQKYNNSERRNGAAGWDREAALYKCDPERDAGYTRADPRRNEHSFCAFFARGCCREGSNCAYRHTIPTEYDNAACDISVDVFGRQRYASHKDDMCGVGSFSHECRTLFVGGLNAPSGINDDYLSSLKAVLQHEFSNWGEVQDIRIIPRKNIAFITYKYRLQAEFAKVAMADQSIDTYATVLIVKWAFDTNSNNDGKNALTDSCSDTLSLKTCDTASHPMKRKYENTAEFYAAQYQLSYQSYRDAWYTYWYNMYKQYYQSTMQLTKAASPVKEDNEDIAHKVRRLDTILQGIPETS